MCPYFPPNNACAVKCARLDPINDERTVDVPVLSLGYYAHSWMDLNSHPNDAGTIEYAQLDHRYDAGTFRCPFPISKMKPTQTHVPVFSTNDAATVRCACFLTQIVRAQSDAPILLSKWRGNIRICPPRPENCCRPSRKILFLTQLTLALSDVSS